jgi:hypothetical protein
VLAPQVSDLVVVHRRRTSPSGEWKDSRIGHGPLVT